MYEGQSINKVNFAVTFEIYKKHFIYKKYITCTESGHANLWFSHKLLRATVVACTKYGCFGNEGSGGLEQQPYFTGSLYNKHLKSSNMTLVWPKKRPTGVSSYKDSFFCN